MPKCFAKNYNMQNYFFALKSFQKERNFLKNLWAFNLFVLFKCNLTCHNFMGFLLPSQSKFNIPRLCWTTHIYFCINLSTRNRIYLFFMIHKISFHMILRCTYRTLNSRLEKNTIFNWRIYWYFVNFFFILKLINFLEKWNIQVDQGCLINDVHVCWILYHFFSGWYKW